MDVESRAAELVRAWWEKHVSNVKPVDLMAAPELTKAISALVREAREDAVEEYGDAYWGPPLRAATEIDNLRARLAAAEKVVEHMQEFIRAVDNDALEMNSPEIGEPESDIPMHPWHEEWLYHAREALTAYQEHSDGR